MTTGSTYGSDGDADRFRALFAATYGDLMRFAERRVHPMAAEEVVAEVFLVVWRRRDEIPQDARPWLFGVARNVMLNQRRQDRRRTALQVRVGEEPAGDLTGDPADQLTRHLDLLSAWRRLDTRDQETIALVAWDELTPTQAAALVGCSRGTFALRLHRARARLSRHLDDHRADPADATRDGPTTGGFPSHTEEAHR